jgi:DNA-binding Xre family transcriptional regulator
MEEGLILFSYVESKRVNKTRLAKELNMSKQNLYQIFKSNELQLKTKQNIEKILKVKWSEIMTKGKARMVKVNIDDNVARETGDNIQKNIVSEAEAEYKNGGDKEKYNARSIYNLTESNRVIAESNASLARSHEELVAMLKNSIAYARPKITVDDASTRTDFLELIARIGSGEKIWNSRAEADAALSKFVLVPNMGDTKEDTRAGSGKGHKKLDS